VSAVRELGSETVHYAWDNAIAPRLEIDSGETVRFQCRDAFDGVYTRDSKEIVKRVAKGHPLTGPVAVRGAQPRDVLQVDVLDLVPGDFGVTTLVPHLGVLAGEFPEPYVKVWDLDGKTAELRPGVRVPLAPFLGVMGVALADPGEHSTIPPRAAGGNMDIKQLTKGSTLYLPIGVAGALFSCGDGHAAQGDGEVCVTAIETTMTATLRLTVRRDLRIAGPEFETASAGALAGRHYVTTGIGPDLMEASKAAVRAMITHLGTACGLTREDAYVLCSVAVDLKISEAVDAPNWVVSAFLPMSLFG
jgi:acetamidase/formamidase